MPISWLISLFRGAEDKGPVGLVYETLVAQARNPYFYKNLNVEDSVDGRFDMIALHYFIVMDRLRHDSSLSGLSQKLANLIISDMDRSLREMGVGDLGVGKRVQNMGKALYGRMEAYDFALYDALEGDMKSLEDVIARNIFRSEEETSSDSKELAKYILKQKHYLSDLNGNDLANGKLSFDEVQVQNVKEKKDE